jgi:hypothetical protein
VAEEVVGNRVGVGEQFDREPVGEGDQGRGEVLRAELEWGLAVAGCSVEEAGNDGSEAAVALGESLGGHGVATVDCLTFGGRGARRRERRAPS